MRLSAPAEAVATPRGGADSLLGEIAAPGFACVYDLGPYSDPLSELALVERFEVAGGPARLVAGPPNIDGLQVPRIADTPAGPLRLTITCESEDAAARERAREMLRSVRAAP